MKSLFTLLVVLLLAASGCTTSHCPAYSSGTLYSPQLHRQALKEYKKTAKRKHTRFNETYNVVR